MVLSIYQVFDEKVGTNFAGKVSFGTTGRGTYAIGIRYQRTGEDTAD
jgi:hypothetical protein